MIFYIITLFPEMFSGPLTESILKRAQEKNLIQINLHQLRDWGIGKHKQVDDTLYGGGPGMLLKPDVVVPAIEAVVSQKKLKKQKVILLTPQGQTLNQSKVVELAKNDRLILVCGHYEGFDERIRDFVDEQISIGDYVLTGGELAAMILIDAISRQIPGVLTEGAANDESFSQAASNVNGQMSNVLEYPQYTKPADFRGLKVPDVLLSGNHQKIAKWREENMRSKKHKKNC